LVVGAFEGLIFWGSILESRTTPEVGGVVIGAKCTFGWTFSVLGALVCKVFRTTFNAAGGVVVIVLRLVVAKVKNYKILKTLSFVLLIATAAAQQV